MTSIKVADPHIDEYPKIETLYDRDPATFKVIEGAYRCPEFTAINRWLVTEKVDGTNVRVAITASGNVYFRGRTDNAQFHPPLLAYLQTTFTPEKMATLWKDDARPPPDRLVRRGIRAEDSEGRRELPGRPSVPTVRCPRGRVVA